MGPVLLASVRLTVLQKGFSVFPTRGAGIASHIGMEYASHEADRRGVGRSETALTTTAEEAANAAGTSIPHATPRSFPRAPFVFLRNRGNHPKYDQKGTTNERRITPITTPAEVRDKLINQIKGL